MRQSLGGLVDDAYDGMRLNDGHDLYECIGRSITDLVTGKDGLRYMLLG